jgi:hypothetical protein
VKDLGFVPAAVVTMKNEMSGWRRHRGGIVRAVRTSPFERATVISRAAVATTPATNAGEVPGTLDVQPNISLAEIGAPLRPGTWNRPETPAPLEPATKTVMP